MRLDVVNHAGHAISTIDVDDTVFGIEPNVPVMHQVVVAQQANRRAGTHSTKRRGEVEGSTKKIRPQKGTGRARQGSIRAPHHTGGGIAFGPKTRDYSLKTSKMLRRLAIRSALSAKVRDGSLIVIDDLQMDSPKTRVVVTLIASIGAKRAPLIITGNPNRSIFLSTRNIPGAEALPASHINAEALLRAHHVVLTVEAVRQVEALWGGQRARDRRAPIRLLVKDGELMPHSGGSLSDAVWTRMEDLVRRWATRSSTVGPLMVVGGRGYTAEQLLDELRHRTSFAANLQERILRTADRRGLPFPKGLHLGAMQDVDTGTAKGIADAGHSGGDVEGTPPSVKDRSA